MELAPRARGARVIAGIDEAGLGPLLGPLVLGFSVFTTRERTADLWRALDSIVSREPADDRAKFVVADSKVVFDRTPRGEKRLEATALGFVALLDAVRTIPCSAEHWICDHRRQLAPSRETLALHPWFARLPKLPRCNDAKALELRVEHLHRALCKQGIALVDAGVRVVPEHDFNRSIAQTNNKATTSWAQCIAVLRHVWDVHASEGVRCIVDRQGGRMYYGSMLAQTFPDAQVVLVRERGGLSEYGLTEREGPRRMRLIFVEKAETRSFPVALASCLAKFTRELCMRGFNDYFGALEPTLKPTAGYNTDGRRWLEDAKGVLERAGVDREVLVRSR